MLTAILLAVRHLCLIRRRWLSRSSLEFVHQNREFRSLLKTSLSLVKIRRTNTMRWFRLDVARTRLSAVSSGVISF